MKTNMFDPSKLRLGIVTGFCALTMTGAAQAADINLLVGADNNNTDNPLVQPQDPAEAGGDVNQSLNNGDTLQGKRGDNVIVGRLGIDVLLGNHRDDVLIGGLEHFTAGIFRSDDRAFGYRGNDIFMWKPGDGSDFFDGGSQADAVVFGLIGEPDPDAADGVAFEVVNDGQAGEVFIDPDTGLPLIDVTNSPGFCPVIDASTSIDAEDELDALGLDNLVQFVLRGIRDAFEAGEQDEDNGLRVTLHLKDVEYVVCASRDGGVIEVLDLRVSPAAVVSIDDIQSHRLRNRLRQIVR